jgi:hypothetical protein
MNTEITMNEALFKGELKRCISRVITRSKRQGTVGIGNDCLWQLVVSPMQRECPHAPVGTNCAWVARQAFDELVTAAPFNRFVYDQNSR